MRRSLLPQGTARRRRGRPVSGRWILSLAVILTAMSCTGPVQAQSWLYPETLVDLTPFDDSSRSEKTAFLKGMKVWGEFGQYLLERDDDHRWNVTIGGMVELYGSLDWSLFFETHIHLLADPNNEISFNPRAFMWEEGLLFGTRSGGHVFEFGYLHRCKHDVDNLELLETTGREESRSLMYGSITGRWRYRGPDSDTWTVKPLLEAHVYVKLQDQRFPLSARGIEPDIEAMIAALRLKCTVSRKIGEGYFAGITGDIRLSAFGFSGNQRFSSPHKIQTEPAGEVFLDISGEAAILRLFGRYVYLPDSFIRPVPVSSSLFLFGFRIYQ